MKTYLLRLTIFVLICFTLSMPSWGYFVERSTVRLIYFLPNDRPYRAEVVQRMRDEIRNIQEYYASQMQAHGYGRRTFGVETNWLGAPSVYRVNGEHPDKYYLNDTMLVWKEIRERFETEGAINFIVVDNSTNKVNRGDGSSAVPGFAALGGSHAFVAGDFDWITAAHELGHTFHLYHDFRDDSYLMSYGHPTKRQLSACAAKFLAVSPTFNPQIRNRDTEESTVKLLSPQEYPAGAESVKIQLEVSDPDGLHQVFLMVKTKESHHAGNSSEIIACQELNGEKKALVTFNYDGVIPSDGNTSLADPLLHPLSVQTVDTFSNIKRYLNFRDIVLTSESFTPSPTHRKAISGNKQRGVINSPLTAPFVIEIQDQIGRKLTGWPVTFTVTTGGGTLSIANTETDANGRAQTTLTLGPTLGVNTVAAIISGLEPLIFTSLGVEVPQPLLKDGSYRSWSLPLGAIGRFGKGKVGPVTFSPDGNTLAVGSSIGTWLYDVATSRELALLTGHTDDVISVVFSPDGAKLVSVGDWVDGTAKLWDIPTGKNLATFTDTEPIRIAALSPDGTSLAAGSENDNLGRITLWDIETQTITATFQEDMSSILSLAFSPDGKTLASGSYDGKIKIWDVRTRQNRSLAGHADAVRSLAYSPDGTKIVSAGGYDDNTIKLWDAATGNHIRTMSTSAIISVAFSPDGTKLASGEGYYQSGRVKLWDVATGKRIATFLGHTSGVRSVAFSPDSTKIVSGSRDNTIKLWDVSTRSTIATLAHINFYIIACSPDGRTLASTSVDAKVKLWNITTGQNIDTLEGHTDIVRALAFSPDGATLASGAENGKVRLWNVATGKNTGSLVGYRSRIRALAFSPDGATLASAAEDTKVKLWNVATGQNIHTLEHSDTVWSLAFSPDGATLASGTADGKVELWNIVTGQNADTLVGRAREVRSLAFSSDGTTLASGEYDIKLWDMATRQNTDTFKNYTAIDSLAFSPDGTILATGARNLELWDIERKKNILTLEGHTSHVSYVSFSPDQTTLVSRSGDGTVLLWDMSSYLTPTTPLPDVSTLAEDINSDGVVNIVDLTLVASNFGKTGKTAADVNSDGVVNIVDLTLVAGAFGNTAAAPSMWSRHREVVPTRDQVQQWLRQARQINLTDPAFQRGILILEQLLASLTPKEIALLPNYPNPFNPETWIPYQLSEPADVSISIYAADGKLVWTLELGHQPVGIYESWSRAAYWDGKNTLGEPVASGVYFYTLTAGDFTATRKMLIRK